MIGCLVESQALQNGLAPFTKPHYISWVQFVVGNFILKNTHFRIDWVKKRNSAVKESIYSTTKRKGMSRSMQLFFFLIIILRIYFTMIMVFFFFNFMVNLAFCGSFSKGIFINSTMLGRENLIIERESDISLYFTRLAQKKKKIFFLLDLWDTKFAKKGNQTKKPIRKWCYSITWITLKGFFSWNDLCNGNKSLTKHVWMSEQVVIT